MNARRRDHGALVVAEAADAGLRERAAGAIERSDIHTGLLQLGARLEGRGIRWCSLDGHRLPGPAGGELRVLVHPADVSGAEHAVWATGGIAARRGRDPHRRTWFLRAAGTGSTLIVHVATRLGVALGEEASRRMTHGILVNRRHGCVPVVAETESFWLLILRVLERPRPRPSEVVLLRTLARRNPVASSPLAELVTTCLVGDWTAPTLLAAVEHGGELPRLRRRIAPRLQSLRRRISGAESARAMQPLGMTVAVVDTTPAARLGLRGRLRWPFPVVIVHADAHGRPRAETPAELLVGLIRTWWRSLRCRTAARRGALVLLDGYPSDALTPADPIRTRRRARPRPGHGSFPRLDAIAVLHTLAPGDLTDEGTPYRGPGWDRGAPCPVLSVPAHGDPASTHERLARELWELLRWRIASSGIVDPRS